MKRKLLFLVCTSFLFLQCKKSKSDLNEQFKQQFAEELHPHHFFNNIAVISKNDVYYLSEFNATPLRLTNTPTQVKTDVKVSSNGKKVAYLNSSGQPVILDMSGNVLATLTQYPYTTKMDWSNDSQTLCILYNNSIYFYGPSLNIPTMTYQGYDFNSIFGGNINVYSFAISPYNDLLYSYSIYVNYSTQYKVVLKSPNNSTENEFYTNNTQISYLDFVNNTNDMLIGYSSYYDPNSITSLNVYPYLSTSSTSSSFSFGSGALCPIYRSDLNTTIGGIQNNSGTSVLSTQSNGVVTGTVDQFSGGSGTLYVDWK